MARLRNPLIFRDPAYATNISVDLLLSKVLKEGGYKLYASLNGMGGHSS